MLGANDQKLLVYTLGASSQLANKRHVADRINPTAMGSAFYSGAVNLDKKNSALLRQIALLKDVDT